jgi:carbon-monoxide dehydrogenase iron sulfur subunit
MARVYVKEQVCIGCRLCEVYCQLSHSGQKELVKAFQGPNRPVSRVRIEVDKHVSFSVRCQNCQDAPCLQACITGALSRDVATGQVVCDEERCVGCDLYPGLPVRGNPPEPGHQANGQV